MLVDENSRSDITLRCVAVLWPSFLVAVIATGFFFSAFDPSELMPFHADVELDTMGAYTIGFLVFWLLFALSSIGTLYFATVNAPDRTKKRP